MDERVVPTFGPAGTESAGEALARALRAGDRVLLRGGLGGGKTTFVRGILRGLGHPDPREVASPTFALHHRYEGGRLPVDHLDLYRLETAEAMRLQGVLDPLEDSASVTFVEWAERLPDPAPAAALVIEFEHAGDEARRLRFRIAPHAADRVLEALASQPAGDAG